MRTKALVIGFATIAFVFCLVGALAGSPIWLVAGNGFVAALLIFTAARIE